MNLGKRRLYRHTVRATALALVTGLFATLPHVAADAAPDSAAKTHRVITPALEARATLSADHLESGPPSGAAVTPANGRTGPFAGQVVPGFSAAAKGPGGTLWAMPDNGFGAKTNSADFLLRIYQVRPNWASGEIEILDRVELADPDRVLGFPIVNQAGGERLLTGADFDIESLQVGRDGTFWIGDEFGPYVLHFDTDGTLLEAPVVFPAAKSPQNPELGGQAPNLPASGGFEAMAMSPNGRMLYPIAEKALNNDGDRRARVVSEFDTRNSRFTGKTWTYEVDTDANLVADAQVVNGKTLYLLERDDFDGPQAFTKRVYEVRLNRTEPDGKLAKRLVVDLLKLDNPRGLGDGGGWGTGSTFSFGLRSVETIVPMGGGKLFVASDNNFPGDAARNPGTPDDTEMILLDLRSTTRQTVNPRAVIGHRGASGYRPEHTLASYELAIQQCADVIEPDLVMTKDGVLVARHEPEISGTTDVAARPEFADRKTTKSLDGESLTGWFVDDFTLAELRTLRAVERIPGVRPQNVSFNGLYPVPTFAEVLDLARHSRTCAGKQVGVAPETKHPTYSAGEGLPMEVTVVRELKAAGLDDRRAPVTIQSFEVANLQRLNQMTEVRLAQLINCSGAPYDFVAGGDPRTYADLSTAAGLRGIARYADAASFCKNLMIPRTPAGRLAEPTAVIGNAKRAGLAVIGWTFRVENQFLPLEFRSGADPNARGDMAGEIDAFIDAGLEELFTDNPDVGVDAVAEFNASDL